MRFGSERCLTTPLLSACHLTVFSISNFAIVYHFEIQSSRPSRPIRPSRQLLLDCDCWILTATIDDVLVTVSDTFECDAVSYRGQRSTDQPF